MNLEHVVFPPTINVTEQDIDISALTSRQKEFYLKLFSDLLDLYQKSAKKRLVVGLAGPTGSGKSVIASILKTIAGQVELTFQFESLGIDAFHYPNEYLEHKLLKEYKGRYDTYDVSALVHLLSSFKGGDDILLPVYSRKTHNPIKNITLINREKSLLFVEGLWLFYEQDGWEHVGDKIDVKLFLDADKTQVRNGAVQRHVMGGRTREGAERYYETVDAPNHDIVMATKDHADRVLKPFYELVSL